MTMMRAACIPTLDALPSQVAQGTPSRFACSLCCQTHTPCATQAFRYVSKKSHSALSAVRACLSHLGVCNAALLATVDYAQQQT